MLQGKLLEALCTGNITLEELVDGLAYGKGTYKDRMLRKIPALMN